MWCSIWLDCGCAVVLVGKRVVACMRDCVCDEMYNCIGDGLMVRSLSL